MKGQRTFRRTIDDHPSLDDPRLPEVNKFRLSKGMTQLKPTERKCLKCDRNFLSAGAQNRICNSCGQHHHYDLGCEPSGVFVR